MVGQGCVRIWRSPDQAQSHLSGRRFGFLGFEVQIELIQQHDATPSIYRDFLQSGRSGLQHVAAWVTRAGFDERKRELLTSGAQLAQEGTIPSSGVRLAYFTASIETDGLVFEIADLLELGQLVKRPSFFRCILAPKLPIYTGEQIN